MQNTLYYKLNTIGHLTLTLAIMETIAAIPVLGGGIIACTLDTILLVFFGLYLTSFILTIQAQVIPGAERYNTELTDMKVKFIIGMGCSLVAIIPGLGWIIHVVMAILMWLQYSVVMILKNKATKDDIIEDVKAENIKTGKDKAENPKVEETKSEDVILGDNKVKDIKVENIKTGDDKSENITVENTKSEDVNPGDDKVEDVKVEDIKTKDIKPEDDNKE